MTTTEHVPGQLDLDGRPLAEDFTPEQAARLAVIEAAPDADEALRVRVAEALYRGWFGKAAGVFADEPPGWRGVFLAQADASLAVIRQDARR